MSNITTITGQLVAKDSQRYAVLVGRFNGFINESLLEGAKDALLRSGVSAENISVIYVPGAFEIPLIAQKCANSDDYDAVIALGSVIRGSTAHFDFVAAESAKGLSKVQLDSGKPIVNGILTTDTIEQAVERAGTKAGNKGAEAAITAIEMLNVLDQL